MPPRRPSYKGPSRLKQTLARLAKPLLDTAGGFRKFAPLLFDAVVRDSLHGAANVNRRYLGSADPSWTATQSLRQYHDTGVRRRGRRRPSGPSNPRPRQRRRPTVGHGRPGLPLRNNMPPRRRYRRRSRRTKNFFRYPSRARSRFRKRYGGYKKKRFIRKGKHRVAKYTKASLLGRQILIRPPSNRNQFRRYQFKDMHADTMVTWYDQTATPKDPRMYPGYCAVKCSQPFSWFAKSVLYNTVADVAGVTCPQIDEVTEYFLAAVEACSVKFVVRRKHQDAGAMTSPLWMGAYVTDFSDDHLDSPFAEGPHMSHEWIRQQQRQLGARLIVGNEQTTGQTSGPAKPWVFTKTVRPRDWTLLNKKIIDNTELEFNWNEGAPAVKPSLDLYAYLWTLPAFNDIDVEILSDSDGLWVETYVTYDVVLYGRRDTKTHETHTGIDVQDADRHPVTADH